MNSEINEEGTEGQKYTSNKEHGSSVKYLIRTSTTFSILQTIEFQGNLFTCLTMGCKYQKDTFVSFVDMFYKVFSATSLWTNDPELMQTVEGAFSENRDKLRFSHATNQKVFEAISWTMIDLWKSYLIELKNSGQFNPEVTTYEEGKGDVFLNSVG